MKFLSLFISLAIILAIQVAYSSQATLRLPIPINVADVTTQSSGIQASTAAAPFVARTGGGGRRRANKFWRGVGKFFKKIGQNIMKVFRSPGPDRSSHYGGHQPGFSIPIFSVPLGK